MYKILGTDQKEYGPVTADTLRQWIAERRANGQTMICLDGTTDWKALASFPEFNDALTSAFGATVTTGVTGAPQVVGRADEPKKGLAIASLVLGILSVACLMFITGIPAIITGIMAINRTRRQPGEYGGRGFAIAGVVLGAAGILLTLVSLGLVLPALNMVKARALAEARGRALAEAKGETLAEAQSISCINNLKQVGLAARVYAIDHKGAFPADFEAMKDELGTPKILWCRSDNSKTRAESWAGFGPNNVTYLWMGAGLNEGKVNPGQVIARCPIHENTVLADGSAHVGRRR